MRSSRDSQPPADLAKDISVAHHAARSWHRSSLLLVAAVAAAAPQVYQWWFHHRVYDQPVDVLVDSLNRGQNVDLAIEGLRAHGLEIIRAIEKYRTDESRRGMLARNALDHFAKELSR